MAKEYTVEEKMRAALELAVRYLEHPDVVAIGFAMPSDCVAKRIRQDFGIEPLPLATQTYAEIAADRMIEAGNELQQLAEDRECRGCGRIMSESGHILGCASA